MVDLNSRKGGALLLLGLVMLILVALAGAYAVNALTSTLQVLFSATVIVAIVGGAFSFASDRISERNASIQSMWKHADEYMTSYYFPLSYQSGRISKYIEDWLKLKNQDIKQDDTLILMFSSYCRFYSIYDQMTKLGIYIMLKRPQAEDCVQILRDEIIDAPKFGYADDASLGLHYNSQIVFGDFRRNIQEGGSMYDLYSKFANWALSNEADVKVLRQQATYFAALILEELNLLYEPWYGEQIPSSRGESLSDVVSYLRSEKLLD